MNINNIALVRATNIIPFDGVVRPISNALYLCKNIGLEFSYRISDLLKELNVIEPMDYTRLDDERYYDDYVHRSNEILKAYLPYVSDYNSFVLFSLNGICPDDNEHGFANNTFSNKKCAIIEPLINHINEAISLVPTDTAVKGDVILSKDAIILIEENTFKSLSEEQVDSLRKLDLKVKTFNCSLKEAIYEELNISNRYIPETLSLTASTNGIMDSDTSEIQKELINSISKEYGLSQMKYYNLLTTTDKEAIKYDEVCEEFNSSLMVQDYYMIKFLEKLLVVLNAPGNLRMSISNNLNNKAYILEIVNLIKNYGIDNYKNFVDYYNNKLEMDRSNGLLMKPSEIVNNTHNKNMNK